MNIEQYRALKAQEAEKTNDTNVENKPDDVKTETKNDNNVNETKIEEKPNDKQDENKINENKEEPTIETKIPEKVVIDGIGEVPFDELTKGYLRQSDYTRKAQELAKQNKEAQEALEFYNQVKNNPQVAEKLKEVTNIPSSADPVTAKIVELETKLYDMMLQNEIGNLQLKYPDFEIREVLQLAYDKRIANLEDAYLLLKSSKTPKQQSVDVETLKKQLREEIMKEIGSEKNTSSIISTNDQVNPIKNIDTPKISSAEEKVAKKMFKDVKNPIAEYIKWRDGGQRKKR